MYSYSKSKYVIFDLLDFFLEIQANYYVKFFWWSALEVCSVQSALFVQKDLSLKFSMTKILPTGGPVYLSFCPCLVLCGDLHFFGLSACMLVMLCCAWMPSKSPVYPLAVHGRKEGSGEGFLGTTMDSNVGVFPNAIYFTCIMLYWKD